jgi:putative ABC transport system substrate-binding protein
MRRRAFINLMGGAASWPLAVRAQQTGAMPVIGLLHSQSPEEYAQLLRRFRQGLRDVGFVEGENVSIEYRWANNELERLPVLAAELVRRRVAVIVSLGGATVALAAKAATTTIPIVFNSGDDPIRRGIVASLRAPGGNLTGVSFLALELSAKRLELLRELVPGAARIAVLVNPAEADNTEITLRDVETAARRLGLQAEVFEANTSDEINHAFDSIGRERPDALFAALTPFLQVRRVHLVQLAAFHRVPTAFGLRVFAEVGGLMSYGASIGEAYHQVGIYAGRILKGAKPADLPVVQSTRFELVINRQTPGCSASQFRTSCSRLPTR